MAKERRVPTVVVRATGRVGDVKIKSHNKAKGGTTVTQGKTSEKLDSYDVSDLLLTFDFEDNAKLVDKCDLTLRNDDLALLDDPHFRLGSEIEVAWGYVDELCEPRKMVITKLSGSIVLKVEALGEAVKMDRQHKGRRFDNMTRSAVVRKIADEYGFGTDADIEDTAVVLPSITQDNLTDAQFIAKLAAKEKFEFYVKKSGLVFRRKNLTQDPVARFVYYNGEGSGDFMTFDYEEDAKAKKGAVTAKGRDPLDKKDVQAKAANDTTKGRPTLNSNVSLYSEAVNQQTGETQKRYAVPPAREEVRPSSAHTEAQAKRDAEADYLGEQHGAVKLKFEIVGNPSVTARKIVQVEKIGKRLSGRWYVDKIVSKIGAGFVQHLECTSDTHAGYGDAKADVKAQGNPNKKAVKTDTVKPVEQVNQQTGETRTVYRRE